MSIIPHHVFTRLGYMVEINIIKLGKDININNKASRLIYVTRWEMYKKLVIYYI